MPEWSDGVHGAFLTPGNPPTMDDTETLLSAARHMSGAHGPDHERFFMWAQLATWLSDVAARMQSGSDLAWPHPRDIRGALGIANGYLDAVRHDN